MGTGIITVRRTVMCLAGFWERVGGASFATLFATHILQRCGAKREAYITLDTYAAPRVSGGLCITLYDLLRIGQMVCDGGLVDGTAVVPGEWIADIAGKRDNHIWLAQMAALGRAYSPMAIIGHNGTSLTRQVRLFVQLVFMGNGCGSTHLNGW